MPRKKVETISLRESLIESFLKENYEFESEEDEEIAIKAVIAKTSHMSDNIKLECEYVFDNMYLQISDTNMSKAIIAFSDGKIVNPISI